MAYTSAAFYILANDEDVTPQDIERYEDTLRLGEGTAGRLQSLCGIRLERGIPVFA